MNLLSFTDARYTRRLVKALNEAAINSGIYFDGKRYTRARTRKGALEVKSPSTGAYVKLDPSSEFEDGYGRSITASRFVS